MNVPFMGGVETPHAIAAGSEAFPGKTFLSLLFCTNHALSGIVRGLDVGGFLE